MNNSSSNNPLACGVLSLGELLTLQPAPQPCMVEPGLLPPQGIFFCGGEPKVGKSLLVANLAFCLAAGSSRAGFHVSTRRRVLMCQFELPVDQFTARLTSMRRSIGMAADGYLFVDTRAAGHLLSTPAGLNHFLAAARSAAAEVIILDPLYSAHDQDENDTRAMAALCQSLLRLRDASKAALIVVHHVRKSIGRNEIGTAFRGSSALHAVGDSYMLLTRPSPQHNTVELRFQFRYAPPQPPRLLNLDPDSLWFFASGQAPTSDAVRHKVEIADVTAALAAIGPFARYNELRHRIMSLTNCSKRTAQLAIAEACRIRSIVQEDGHYRLPL
jgi:hypothetical protein